MFGLSAVKLIVIGVLLASVGGAVWYITHRMAEATIQENRADALQAENDSWKAGWATRNKQDVATQAANKSNAGTQGNVGTNTQEIIRYVDRYITAKADTECKLPDDFGRVLDAAELGVSPDSLPAGAGQPGRAAPALSLSEATRLLTQTLGDYAALRARILNAHADWQAQAAIANGDASSPPPK